MYYLLLFFCMIHEQYVFEFLLCLCYGYVVLSLLKLMFSQHQSSNLLNSSCSYKTMI